VVDLVVEVKDLILLCFLVVVTRTVGALRPVVLDRWPDLLEGSNNAASLGSFRAAYCSSSYVKVERQPLPPPVSVTVPPFSRLLMVIFNLQATVQIVRAAEGTELDCF
jgi:hypothetical protein